MRLKVDSTKCSGIGICEMTAPAVYQVADDGLSHVVRDEPADDDMAAVAEAIANCPTAALSIES